MEAADVGNQQVPAGPDHGSKQLKGSARLALKAWLIGCGRKDCSPLCANSLVEVLFAL
jgi:hypothetical protein